MTLAMEHSLYPQVPGAKRSRRAVLGRSTHQLADAQKDDDQPGQNQDRQWRHLTGRAHPRGSHAGSLLALFLWEQVDSNHLIDHLSQGQANSDTQHQF